MRRALMIGFSFAGFLILSIAGFLTYDAFRDHGPEFIRRKGELKEVRLEEAGRDSVFQKSWLTLKNADGFAVECGLLVPAPSQSHRYPAIILLGGKATGKHAVDYVLGIRDVVMIAPDYPFSPRSSYTVTEFLHDAPGIRAALLDMVPAVMLATDYLRSRPDVDTTRIILVGYSFGAPLVPCVAALDREFAAVAMVYGGGNIGRLVRHNVRRYEGEVTAWMAGALAAVLLRPLEPMRYASRITPTPLIMINGVDDEQIPAASAREFFDAAREPKKQIWLSSKHVRPDNVALTRAIVHALSQELASLGLVPQTSRQD